MRVASLLEILAIVVLFLMRLGVPIAITALVTWWLRRLDAKWQAEAAPAALPPQQPGVSERRPCWEIRACPEERRAHCPAFLAPEIACWLARLRAEGHMPAGCSTCAAYRPGEGVAAAGD